MLNTSYLKESVLTLLLYANRHWGRVKSSVCRRERREYLMIIHIDLCLVWASKLIIHELKSKGECSPEWIHEIWEWSGWPIGLGRRCIVQYYIVEVMPPVTPQRYFKTIYSLKTTHITPCDMLWLPFQEQLGRLAPGLLASRSSDLGEDIDSRRWDQGGFLLRWIIKDLLTHRYHACLMCVAQVAPLKAAFPSSSSTTGTVYPQCRWVSTKAPLKQVAHIQNRRLLPTQRRLLPIPAYLRRDIVGHAVGAESGSLLTLWCWVSPANSSSSRAHENKNRADFPLSPLVYFCFSLSLLVYFVFHYLPWCIFAFHYLSWWFTRRNIPKR